MDRPEMAAIIASGLVASGEWVCEFWHRNQAFAAEIAKKSLDIADAIIKEHNERVADGR